MGVAARLSSDRRPATATPSLWLRLRYRSAVRVVMFENVIAAVPAVIDRLRSPGQCRPTCQAENHSSHKPTFWTSIYHTQPPIMPALTWAAMAHRGHSRMHPEQRQQQDVVGSWTSSAHLRLRHSTSP